MMSTRGRSGRSNGRVRFGIVSRGGEQRQIGDRSLILVRNRRRFVRRFRLDLQRSRRLSGAFCRRVRTFSLRRWMGVMERIGGRRHQSLTLTQSNDDHDVHRRDERQGKNV